MKRIPSICIVISILIFCLADSAHADIGGIGSEKEISKQWEFVSEKAGLTIAYLTGHSPDTAKNRVIKPTEPKAKKINRKLIKRIRKLLKKKRRKRRCLT